MATMLTVAIQKEAARILQENLVDVVIGFQPGTLPLKSRPAFIRHADQANRLVHNGLGASNLAVYIPRRPRDERIGLVCRACESRAVRALLVEQQHLRESLYLIGVPCFGVLDAAAIAARAKTDVKALEETNAQIEVVTSRGTYRWPRQQMLHAACGRCRSQKPVGVDRLLGEFMEDEPLNGPPGKVDMFAALSPEARAAEFAHEANRCIRCYACREACPMCYCTQCFVDHTAPRWMESTVSPAGNQAWHIIRAFHQSGRCVGCGACERACPMDIPMTHLTEHLNLQMAQAYGFVAGEDEAAPPPFAAFSLDDAGRFER